MAPLAALALLASFVSSRAFVGNSASQNVFVYQPRSSVLFSSTTDNTKSTPDDGKPRLSGLAFMLDDGTRKSHSMAENSAFMTGFFKGLSNRDSFRNLVTSLYFVYSAMEEAFDETSNENVRTMDDKELRRVPALEKDMEFFYGAQWRTSIEPSAYTKAYVARIKEVAEKKQHLLVAHQYTRYLGDLFGGQIMGGMATRSLNLEGSDGVAFYKFDDIPSSKDFIKNWYQRLNELDMTDEERKELVDEANFVYTFNIGIFQELEGSPITALWALAVNTFKSKVKDAFLGEATSVNKLEVTAPVIENAEATYAPIDATTKPVQNELSTAGAAIKITEPKARAVNALEVPAQVEGKSDSKLLFCEQTEGDLDARYASIDSLEEKAFTILVDLGMVDITPEPEQTESPNELVQELIVLK